MAVQLSFRSDYPWGSAYCETDELVAGACIWTMRIAENNYLAGTEPLIKQLNLTAYTRC
ncbi:MAG: hypothetical protein H7A09_07005 [Oceanospirillaceae bacterium]|nr:hypothetical protein [Oceanospirillaceae bacterium]